MRSLVLYESICVTLGESSECAGEPQGLDSLFRNRAGHRLHGHGHRCIPALAQALEVATRFPSFSSQ